MRVEEWMGVEGGGDGSGGGRREGRDQSGRRRTNAFLIKIKEYVLTKYGEKFIFPSHKEDVTTNFEKDRARPYEEKQICKKSEWEYQV